MNCYQSYLRDLDNVEKGKTRLGVYLLLQYFHGEDLAETTENLGLYDRDLVFECIGLAIFKDATMMKGFIS